MFGIAIFIMALLCPTSAAAEKGGRSKGTEINGFASLVYSQTDESAFFHGGRDEAGINRSGSIHGTRVGINVRSRLNDRVAFAGQVISIREEDDFTPAVEWAFAEARLKEGVDLRAGKVKFPVGLVNEYVDVGVTYPGIRPPLVIYYEEPGGPQATREAYTGASLLLRRGIGDWAVSADFFGGEVGLEQMRVKGLQGLSLRAEWKNMVEFHAAGYRGEMSMSNPMMDGKEHRAALVGVSADWSGFVFYHERAEVRMDIPGGMRDSSSYYYTLGRRFGKFMPYASYESWSRKDSNGSRISSAGGRYDLYPNAAVKLEIGRISTDGSGFFELGPGETIGGGVMLYSVAFDVIF